MFDDATQNNYKISFDEWYTERRLISDSLVQHDIGSTQQANSPKYIISAHQTRPLLMKKIIILIFHNLDFRKYYIEIDGRRYPRDSVLINYEENDYIQQYKYLNSFLKNLLENQYEILLYHNQT